MLLHCCCGPCATAVIDFFVQKNVGIAAFFFNPNIWPNDENQKRLEAFIKVCNTKNVPYLVEEEPAYVHKKGMGSCNMCYDFRLQRTAVAANRLGLESFSTTLLVSPYQNHKRLKMIGESKAGFAYFDLRGLYQDTVNQSKALGIYRQHYCGCESSQFEALWMKKRVSESKRVKSGPYQEWVPDWLKK